MASPATKAIFEALKAIWSADRDRFGGGCQEYKVRSFERMGTNRGKLTPPYILVDVIDPQADSVANQAVDAVVRLHIFTYADHDIDAQDTVVQQLSEKLHEQPIDGTEQGWSLQRPVRLRGGRGPADAIRVEDRGPRLRHWVEEYSVIGRRVAS